MIYFLKKKTRKIAAALGPAPPNPRWPLGASLPDSRVVTPIICYAYLFDGFCSLNIITVKKEQK